MTRTSASRLSIFRTRTAPAVARRQRWLDSDGRHFAWSCWKAPYGYLDVDGIGVFRLSSESMNVEAFVRPETDPALVELQYRRTVRQMVLQTHGWQILHASAVRSAHGLIGFCGRSGTGKSTLAKLWAEAGDLIWADDALALRVCDGAPQSISLVWDSTEGREGGGRAVMNLTALVVLAAQTTEPSPPDFETLSPSGALRALLPHALSLDPEEPSLAAGLFRDYVDLSKALPVHRLTCTLGHPGAPEMARWLKEKIAQSVLVGTR